MSARYLVGDVFDRLAELETGSVDLVITSPPFLALRSYLPADHPDKSKEIGSEATPAAFLDVMLKVMGELRRVTAAHGSVCIELGDTYAGPQPPYRFTANHSTPDQPLKVADFINGKIGEENICGRIGEGWPLAKSRALVPELFRVALAYGINPLTGQPSPAGKWLVRNVVTWCRPNPPVGALGDKWRPATSDVVVACTSPKRYWDDVATRRPLAAKTLTVSNGPQPSAKNSESPTASHRMVRLNDEASGAPLLDYWEIPLLDGEEPRQYGPKEKPKYRKETGRGEGDKRGAKTDGGWSTLGNWDPSETSGAPLLDYWEIPPTGYSGSHYAVYPPALVEPLVKAMCPQKVCRTCGQPSRRMFEHNGNPTDYGNRVISERLSGGPPSGVDGRKIVPTGEWSSCGHDNYRPGLILDPFAGSGTTLLVATGHGHDALGIDLDERNAELALERVGPFLLDVVV